MNKHTRQTWEYPDVRSVRRPQPHSDRVPVPVYEDPEAELGSEDDSDESLEKTFLPAQEPQ